MPEKPNKPRRRWWQRLLRLGVVVLLALAGLYAALPWWLPKAWLRDKIQERLSQAAGVPVRIGGLDVSWGEGIEIRELVVPSREPNDPPALSVACLRAEFSPLKLAQDRLSWMEIEAPRVFLCLGERKEVEPSPLEPLLTRGDLRTDRTRIHQGSVTLKMAGRDKPFLLDLADVEVIAGRYYPVGRVTLAGGLVQERNVAPISLLFTEGPRDANVLGRVMLSFGNLDLDDLGLKDLLQLPLKQLSGTCGGEVDLAASMAHGQIDQFDANVTVRRLSAQPAQGPELPVIEQAFIRVSTTIGVGGRVTVRAAAVRLPGVDLAARGETWLGPTGQLERVSALEVDGTVEPEHIAVLLRGREEPNDLQVRGPVRVHLACREERHPPYSGGTLAVEGNFVVGEAAIRSAGRLLKPAGRKLDISLDGNIDLDRWSYAGRLGVALGGNRFDGGGEVKDLRGLQQRWSDANRPPTARDIPEALAHLKWDGAWEVRELAALTDLLGVTGFLPVPGQVENLPRQSGAGSQPVPARLGDVWRSIQIDGPLTGRWFVQESDAHGTSGQLIAITAPADTRLTVPGVFTKLPGREMKLSLQARMDAAQAHWENLEVSLACGGGTVHLHGGEVWLAESNESGVVFATRGRWDAQDPRAFLGDLGMEGIPGLDVSGDLEGGYFLATRPAGASGEVELRADRAAFAYADLWRKPAGEPALCRMRFHDALEESGDGNWFVKMEILGPKATIAIAIKRPQDCPHGRLADFSNATAEGHVDIKDASWLTESSPRLAAKMAGGRIKGPSQLHWSGTWSEDSFEANVALMADGLEFELPDGVLSKPSGMAFGFEGDCKWIGALYDGSRLDVLTTGGSLRFGPCRARFLTTDTTVSGKYFPHVEELLTKPLYVRGNFDVEVDANVPQLVPGLAGMFREHGIDGEADAGGSFSILRDGNSLGFWFYGGCDFTETAIRSWGGFSKPAGVRLAWMGQAGKRADDPNIELEPSWGEFGDSNWVHEGRLAIAFSATGPPRIGEYEGSLSLHVPDASQFKKFLPALAWSAPADANESFWRRDANFAYALYDPNGSFSLAARWAGDANSFTLSRVDFRSAGASAMLRGRRVSLAGDLSAEGVRLTEANSLPLVPALLASAQGLPSTRLRVAKVATGGLEFRAGPNHGWLVAEAADLGEPNLAARAHVLADLIDDKDLADWLAPASEAPSAELSPAEKAGLEANSVRLVRDLRRVLERADVDLRIDAKLFRSFDEGVQRIYEMREMVLEGSANRGRLRIAITGGVSGGTYRKVQEANLLDALPMLHNHATTTDALATPATRAQLLRVFPGNSVYGSFSHTEKLTLPLWSAVANMTDSRWPVRGAGSSETAALTGVVEGRAAPLFVTSIFPGLNTTKYRYKSMRAFSTILPDGTVESDMIFSGETYDLYMEGATDGNCIARFETGLILLSPPQSPELNHDLKLGRIPILKIKARVQNGVMHDVEVSYPWPTESAFTIFIRNNPFYRIWATLNKK